MALNGEYGVIDKRGNTMVPFDSGWKRVFRNGTFAIAASAGGKYRLADRNGNTMNNTLYDWIQQSGDGYMVKLDHKYGFFDLCPCHRTV